MRFYVEYSSNRVTGVKNCVFTREYQNVRVVGLQIVGFFLEYENFRVMNVRNRFRQNKIKFQNSPGSLGSPKRVPVSLPRVGIPTVPYYCSTGTALEVSALRDEWNVEFNPEKLSTLNIKTRLSPHHS